MTTPTETDPLVQRGPGGKATAGLLGAVMPLVAAAIGFAAIGAVLGRNLSLGASVGVSLGAVVMLLLQALEGQRFRVGGFAVGWLFAVGLAIGLGFGPVLSYYASVSPTAITQAAVATALVVMAMGSAGLLVDKDLAPWMRPVALAFLATIVLVLLLFVFGGSGSPLISLVIAGLSALLILVDFNYIRHHGTEDDVVVLATGISVSVVNIFTSLLNLFGPSEAG